MDLLYPRSTFLALLILLDLIAAVIIGEEHRSEICPQILNTRDQIVNHI
jgi:hypothetical protein